MSSYYDDASLMLLASGGAQKDGKVYSVKPTDGSGDFTFTRGSNLSATRVDASQLIEKGRENLLLQSNQFDTTWIKSDTSVTSGQSGYDGTNDAWLLDITAATGFQTLRQTISNSGAQTFSIYAKAGTLDWIRFSFTGGTGPTNYYDISNGALGSVGGGVAEIEDVGNGWYRCSAFFSGSFTQVRIYPATANNNANQSSGNILIQDAQLEQGLVATPYIETGATTAQAGILENTPRFDYSGGATCPSLLLEPSRTNTIVASEYIAAGVTWSAVNMLTESNAETSPEGVQNATKIIRNAVSGNSAWLAFFNQGSVGNNVVYSAFAKAGTNSQLCITYYDSFTTDMFFNFDLVNGQIASVPTGSAYYVDAGIEDYGNGWYRCYAVVDSQQSTAQYQLSAGGNRGGQINEYIYVYGAMSEIGSYTTSYIPTYGVSQTRAADSCLLNNSSALPTAYPFTLYSESIIKSIGSEISLSFLNTSDNVSYAAIITSSGVPSLNARSSSSDVSLVSPDSVTEGVVKIAGVFESSTLKLFVNGALKASISNTTTFQSGWNDLLVGQLRTITDTGSRTTNKQTIIFPTALSDLDAEILTGATTYNTFAEMALALNYTVYE